MANPADKAPYPHVSQGTSMVDRINLSMHTRKYVKMVGGRWWLLALCALVGTGVNAYRAFQTPNLYQAYSILTIPAKVAIQNTKAPVLELMDKFYESRLSEMRSPVVLRRTEERVGKLYPRVLRPSFTPVAEQSTTGSFRLVVTSTDFNYALAFSTNWAEEVKFYKEERRLRLYGKTAITEQQGLVREEEKLALINAKIQAFRKEHEVGNTKEAGVFAQRQYEILVAERDEVRKHRELLENTNAKRIAEGALTDLSKGIKPSASDRGDGANQASSSLSDPLEKFSGGSRYKELSLQLQGKKAELDKLRPLLKSKHPVMVQLETSLASIEQQLKFELDFIESSRIALLESLRTKEAGYEPVIAKQLRAAQESSNIQDAYQKLTDELEQQKQVIATVNKNLNSIDRGTSSEGDDNYDVPAAGIGDAQSPIWGNPQRKKMILMGFLAGLGVGIGLAYFLQRLDDRLELAEEIEEALGEPVLGQIPMVDSSSNKDGFLLITRLSQHNMFSESIRGVRSAIMLGSEGGLKQLLLVSSAVPGDGKTTFTVNFATTLAIAGHKVLLIDADLRRGNVHFYFRVDREVGMTEILSGKSHWLDVLKQTEVKALHIITTGDLPPNPGELLISPITKEFLAEARMDYDYIIIDCPPLTAIDDTFSLANLADGLLFVVRAGQTSMKFAKNALQAVRHRGARIYGIVLNCITTDNPYYYYSNYYHAYYNKDQANDKPLGDAPRPGSKMAARKRVQVKQGSIEAAAKARSGGSTSRTALAATEAAKSQEFKARRAAQRQVAPQEQPPDPPSPAPQPRDSLQDENAKV